MIRLFAVLLLVGCDPADMPMPDAGEVDIDAPVRVCERLSPAQSVASPIGECCDERAAGLCASGAGVCIIDTCVRQCSGRYPQCPDGSDEIWDTWPDGSSRCRCE